MRWCGSPAIRRAAQCAATNADHATTGPSSHESAAASASAADAGPRHDGQQTPGGAASTSSGAATTATRACETMWSSIESAGSTNAATRAATPTG